jgi:hypothetical protein
MSELKSLEAQALEAVGWVLSNRGKSPWRDPQTFLLYSEETALAVVKARESQIRVIKELEKRVECLEEEVREVRALAYRALRTARSAA